MAKLNVAPTKSNLLSMKDQLSISQNGYDLLNQKREILVMELMHMVEKVKLLEQNLDALVEKSYPALKKMLMQIGGDGASQIASGVKYDYKIKEMTTTIGGMTFPTIDVKLPEKQLFYSALGTSASCDQVISYFFELLKALTDMASIRTIVWRLAAEVKKTQRRVNALDKMVIPQTQETVRYIESVLEERERENVFVLKALKSKNDK